MHFLTIPNPIDLGPQGSFPAGDYLVEDRNAAEIMLAHLTSGIQLSPALYTNDQLKRITPNGIKETILVVALGGYGDCIMLTPVLREIKRRWPWATLIVGCFEQHRAVFSGLSYIDGFETYPIRRENLLNYTTVLFTERAIEYNERAKEQHTTDRYAEHFGIEVMDRFPDYFVQPEEKRWIHATFPRDPEKKRLGVQLQAGVLCRTIPRKTLAAVIEILRVKGWEIVLMGRPGEFIMNKPVAGVIDLTRHQLTFRQSAAYLTSCDAFFGPDSSLLHICGALDVPAVGLFAAYPWQIRTRYYRSVFVIQGHEGCDMAPCFHTTVGSPFSFPVNGPCAKTGQCVPLGNIDPKRIVREIERVAARRDGRGEAGVPARLPGPGPASPAGTLRLVPDLTSG